VKKDDLEWVRLADSIPPFARKKRLHGRRRMGIKYEEKVKEHFEEAFPPKVGHPSFISGPWLEYKILNEGKVRYAQPDGLLVSLDTGVLTICEIKYQHTAQAYWQVMDKYLPLVERLFNTTNMWKIGVCEIVKWYDCAVVFPAHVTLRDCIASVRPGEFGVHIWKP